MPLTAIVPREHRPRRGGAIAGTQVLIGDTGRAAPIYSTYNILGTYRVAFTGVSLSTGTPESGVGVFVADGKGGASPRSGIAHQVGAGALVELKQLHM